MSSTNQQVRLAARPSGLPQRSDWDIVEEPVPAPADGEFVVAISHLSLDPAMRGWMNAGASYIQPVEIGDVMRAGAVGQVSESKHPGFASGEFVYGNFGVQQHALSDGKGVIKIDPSLAPAPTYLGTLGMTGLTAYFGLLDVGKLKEGDTVVVSGAAGAVGSVAGQIAKLKGARVIGIAGGEEKCRWIVEELGFDAAIDYKGEDVRGALRTHAPDGVDLYFDNVGGEILDICLGQLAMKGRVVLCGAISTYNDTGPPKGIANYRTLIVIRGRMEGFLILDYLDRFPEAQMAMVGWVGEGRIKHAEHVVEGLAQAPDALNLLFTGGNTGKVIVRVD
jgi:NADPH-dependent curcumin reductase CurA